MNQPASDTPPTLRRGMERWHWLVAFCLLSLLLHLGVGWNSRNFSFGLPKSITAPPAEEVEISLAPLDPVLPPTKDAPVVKTPTARPAPPAPKVRAAPPPEKPARRYAPKAIPRIAPVERNEPLRARVEVPPVPRETQTEPPKATPPPDFVPPPQPSRLPPVAQVRVGPPPELKMPDPQTVKPPPLGLPSGQRELPAARPNLRAPLPAATPRPLPVPDAVAGKGGGGATSVAAVPNPDVKTVAPEGDKGSGGGKNSDKTGTGEGTASGAGNANAGMGKYGINRGIPFGDLTGLARGGDPNGGRGILGGGVSGGGRDGKPFRMTLQRAVPVDSGPALHIIYVLDTSGSMLEGNKMTRAREALAQALSELRPDDEFNIIAFSDTAHKQFKAMRSAKNSAVSAGTMGIDLMRPQGNTNISAAMDLALDEPGVTHVFLLSDGAPTEGITDFDELRAHVRDKNRAIGARIITLALGLGDQFDGVEMLKGMADDNNGKFDYINLKKSKPKE